MGIVYSQGRADTNAEYILKNHEKYHDILLVYNEDMRSFPNKKDARYGGGNACARPFRLDLIDYDKGSRKNARSASLGVPLDGSLNDIRNAIDQITKTVDCNPQLRAVLWYVDDKDVTRFGTSIFAHLRDIKAKAQKAGQMLADALAQRGFGQATYNDGTDGTSTLVKVLSAVPSTNRAKRPVVPCFATSPRP